MNDFKIYSKMQKDFYESEANKWTPDRRNPVVCHFDEHNKWKDYQYLFDGMETTDKVALDFGCGPGRAMLLYWDKFVRIDGADIAQGNLNNVKVWFKHNKLDGEPKLYLTDGASLDTVPSDTYDVVFSTITLQHICSYHIRLNILKDIFRVLKPGGWFTAQMGYGENKAAVDYYADNFTATGTNGFADTAIDDINEIWADLNGIGFKNFRYRMCPVGPGDVHANWIFFRGQKC